MYADAGDLPRAIAVLEAGVSWSIRTAWSCATRWRRVYEEQGKIDAALRELTGLVKARPDDPAALNALGYTLADHSRELRARAPAHRARPCGGAAKMPPFSTAWAGCCYRQGPRREALTYLRRGLRG